jgi:hypothetical protein
MRKQILGATAVGVVVSVAAGRRLARRRDGVGTADRRVDRWHSVTVFREPEDLGPLPPPLDDLGVAIDVVMRPAPGGRGTELAARIADPDVAGREQVRALRKALREARSLAEIGEVLLPDSPATTRKTLLSAPLAYVTRHGREEGRL